MVANFARKAISESCSDEQMQDAVTAILENKIHVPQVHSCYTTYWRKWGEITFLDGARQSKATDTELEMDTLSDISTSTLSSCPSLIQSNRTRPLRKFPRPLRSDMRSGKKNRSSKRGWSLNAQLILAVTHGDAKEVQRLLDAGASPNATFSCWQISACHIAALHDNEIVSILLEHGAGRLRPDLLGRTPLHIAAWSGNLKPFFALLGFSTELQKKLEDEGVTAEAEHDIKEFADSTNLRKMIAVRCDDSATRKITDVRKSEEYDKDNFLPYQYSGWTPLHAAASSVRSLCCKVLLAAGADPSARDKDGLTPLHVAGTSCYDAMPFIGSTPIEANFIDVVEILTIKQKCCNEEKPERFGRTWLDLKGVERNTSLHAAAEFEDLKALVHLLQSGCNLSPNIMNTFHFTPVHICVYKRNKQLLQVFLDYYLANEELASPQYAPLGRGGYTVLHYAVYKSWLEGVCLCLQVELSRSMEPTDSGDTPLHTAAAMGSLDILDKVLPFAKSINAVNAKDNNGETAVFKAIENGHNECVKMLLQEGASLASSTYRNVFHASARRGHVKILKLLLDHDERFTRRNVNAMTADSGFRPIHLALKHNHIECVNLLLSKNASISLKTAEDSTLLHIAAMKNNIQFVKFILKSQPSQIHEVDKFGWSPLHTAICVRATDIARLLVLHGADLSAMATGPKNYMTATEMIMNNIPKPTEFLESIFDMCIRIQRPKSLQVADGGLSFQDPKIEVIVDYNVLLPKSKVEYCYVKLKVIEALVKTGNTSGQKRLLIHPLVESFICLNWNAFVPFFYIMLFVYGLFVLTLTIFVMSEFGHKDRNHEKLTVPNAYTLYATIVMVLLQEVIFFTVNLKHYILQIETLMKLASIILAIMLPNLMEESEPPSPDTVDWARHVATAAILLCWLYMIFLLSRFPKWGCYVLMFRKVFSNVVKILLTFACLVFGFTLSFMIQFHHRKSFESFWTALVKTMVMMTSEFDYDDLVDSKEIPQMQSLVIVRVVFIIFLILAAVCLMNLMVSVSVNDLKSLEIHGRIMQLEKQVEIVNNICCSLQSMVFRRFFTKSLVMNWLKYSDKLIFKPYETKRNIINTIPIHVRDAIFNNAVAQEKNGSQQTSFEGLLTRLDKIREIINTENIKKLLNERHNNPIAKTKKKHVSSLYDKMDMNVRSDKKPKHSNQKEFIGNMATT